jgi:hypothetical protein
MLNSFGLLTQNKTNPKIITVFECLLKVFSKKVDISSKLPEDLPNRYESQNCKKIKKTFEKTTN